MKRTAQLGKVVILAVAVILLAVPVFAANGEGSENGKEKGFDNGLSQGSCFSAADFPLSKDLLARGGNGRGNGGGGHSGGNGGGGGRRNGDADGSGDGVRPADGSGNGARTGDCTNA